MPAAGHPARWQALGHIETADGGCSIAVASSLWNACGTQPQ